MSFHLAPSSLKQLEAIPAVRPASYILAGDGAGILHAATTELVRRLNCLGDQQGMCANCRRIANETFSDYLVLAPAEKPSIGIEAIRDITKRLSLRPTHGRLTRLLAIQYAETLTTEAQNALLKLTEEPPAQTIIVLATTRPQALLPTIRSRSPQLHIVSDEPSPQNTASSATGPSMLAASPFERLLTAKRLADENIDPLTLSASLQHQVLQTLHEGVSSAIVRRQVAAIEQFRQQTSLGVTTRTGLERLVLSL
jgi:hypothetical protein